MKPHDVIVEIDKIAKEAQSVALHQWQDLQEACKDGYPAKTTEELAMICLHAIFAARKGGEGLNDE